MAKFRKKPVEIEAVTVNEIERKWSNDRYNLPQWVTASFAEKKLRFFCDGIKVDTLEGEMKAFGYDWIIRGVKGELYPCKPDIFEATYEPHP